MPHMRIAIYMIHQMPHMRIHDTSNEIMKILFLLILETENEANGSFLTSPSNLK